MNPDQPSREQIEARLTALLLGELPAAEAELLRWSIARDPELQKLHDQLKLTIGFVREAVKNPAASVEKEASLKLSQERRQTLLAHFKTERPKPIVPPLPRRMSPLIPALIAVAAVALLAVICIPNFVRARATSQANSIINNMRQIDAAKQEWALEERKSPDDVPTTKDLTPYLQGQTMHSVAGENYTLGKVSEPVTAIIDGKRITEPSENFIAMNAAPQNAELPATRTPQEWQARTTLAKIALPSTESPEKKTENNEGYVNANPGASTTLVASSTEPVQMQANDISEDAVHQPVGVTPQIVESPGPGSTLPQAETPSAPAPETVPPQVVTAIPSESAPVIAMNEPLPSAPSASPASPQSNGMIASTGAQGSYAWSANDLGLSVRHGGFAGGGIGGYGGGAGQKNSISGSAGESSSANGLREAMSHATNGSLWDNFAGLSSTPSSSDYNVTNAIAENEGTFYQNQAGEAAPFITREYQNANIISEDRNVGQAPRQSQRINDVTPIPASPAPSAQEQIVLATPTTIRQGNLSVAPPQGISPTVGGVQFAKEQNDFADDAAAAVPGQPAAELQRQLENERDLHQMLAAKIMSDKADASIPQSSMVAIVQPAQPGQSQNLWQRMTGTVESQASVKVEPDVVSDVATFSPVPETYAPYDASFLQTEYKSIESDAVLGKVVDKLNLDQVWSNQNDGEKLSRNDAIALLKSRLDLSADRQTKLINIGAKSGNSDESAKIANAVAEAYQEYRKDEREQQRIAGINILERDYAADDKKISELQAKLQSMETPASTKETDQPLPRPPVKAPVLPPETQTRDNAFSTFSMNISDVSFKLASASLGNGQMPDPASIRGEEFINAFDYRDPEPLQGQPLAFVSERARDPFAQERDLLRFSIKAAAAGRQGGRALNLVLLLDTSGSMERADRVAIIREALRVLASQLQPQDTVSVVTFARTARLWADGIPGTLAGGTLEKVGSIAPEGGTNLEEAMRLAYETALRHFIAGGMNRVVLLTDGAANLGNVDPQALTQKVEAERRQGIALDCFGIGWEDYNDDLLEQLSSNGDGRYAFINSPDEAATEFAAKLAGALQVAAEDVKVQVEFNPDRVTAWRQIGYAKHQLTKEQFRDNTVAAGAIAAREAGNAVYVIEARPDGTGPIATVRVRYRVPGTQDNRERSWLVDYTGTAPALVQSTPAMRLATTAAEFSEWLGGSPYAQNVTPDDLLNYLSGIPQIYGADGRPKQLEWMIRQAKSVSGGQGLP